MPERPRATVGTDPLDKLAVTAGNHYVGIRFNFRIGQVNIIPRPVQDIIHGGIELFGYRIQGIPFLPLIVNPVSGGDIQLLSDAEAVRAVLKVS